MILFRHAFLVLALTASAAMGTALAQRSAPPTAAVRPAQAAPAKSSDSLSDKARKEWDGISTMTKRQWNSMKRRWAAEEAKWRACNTQVRAEKLGTAERWTAIGQCIMR